MIALTLSSEAEKLLASVETFPARVANAIATALQQQNELTLRHVRSARLSGRGPFPPEAGRLGERSGRLRQSLHLTDVRVSDTAIEASLAADAPYAGVHEYGFAGSQGSRTETRVRCGPVDFTITKEPTDPWESYEIPFAVAHFTFVRIQFDCRVLNVSFSTIDRGALLDDVELVQAGI